MPVWLLLVVFSHFHCAVCSMGVGGVPPTSVQGAHHVVGGTCECVCVRVYVYVVCHSVYTYACVYAIVCMRAYIHACGVVCVCVCVHVCLRVRAVIMAQSFTCRLLRVLLLLLVVAFTVG